MNRKIVQAALASCVACMCVPVASAQQALEWAPGSGGNGHWYALRTRDGRTWTQVAAACRAEGGHLATMVSPAERTFMVTVMSGNTCAIGGYQVVSGPQDEPGVGWRWVTDEPMTWTNWASWEPGNTDTYGAPAENVMGCFANGIWVDLADHLIWTQHFVVEWDADCNGDGLVDFGQIVRGQLADHDGNRIPDICEVPSCEDADLFPDHQVNGADLAALLSQWGPATVATRSDINLDGVVNGADLSYLLSFWGPCP